MPIIPWGIPFVAIVVSEIFCRFLISPTFKPHCFNLPNFCIAILIFLKDCYFSIFILFCINKARNTNIKEISWPIFLTLKIMSVLMHEHII